MVVYDSAFICISSQTTLLAKINTIDAIITALEAAALKAAEGEHILDYSLDDGQTKIKAEYRGAGEVMKSIEAYEKLKQMYVNRLNGRKFKLVDYKSFMR